MLKQKIKQGMQGFDRLLINLRMVETKQRIY